MGDHIKKRRLELKLTKSKVASLIPEVIEFLGHVPFNDLSDMSEGEKIIICRRLLGLTQAEMA